MRYKSLHLFLSFAAAFAVGCAPLTHGPDQRVSVTSDPPGAVVTVNCGPAVKSGAVTPTRVLLHRKADLCNITISKDGYQPDTIWFDKQTSVFWFGNTGLPIAAAMYGYVQPRAAALALGVVGWADLGVSSALVTLPVAAVFAGIDYKTGAIYEFTPKCVHMQLRHRHDADSSDPSAIGAQHP